MGKFVKVANKNDITEGKGKALQLEGLNIALFQISGNFYAIDNTCKHRGGPLGEGELDGNQVTCPWHGWEYDVTTGECKTTPGVTQAKYNVKVEGDDILIEV
jgi:nitrite reductase (NADH) small subunit/3-phenylpropionate/trans-cinnamate dioxygenase ferredoxin subunit